MFVISGNPEGQGVPGPITSPVISICLNTCYSSLYHTSIKIHNKIADKRRHLVSPRKTVQSHKLSSQVNPMMFISTERKRKKQMTGKTLHTLTNST